ncbi:dihydrofolate reductase [Candidatus Saccharibacteria bacterium]|nr:dihydrofolate reductase [Candidatus Saccharibacteria bacterium]
MISIIAAIGKNNELGLNGDLVFHLKDDMKYFRETTLGHKVVMGRKTWESLPGKLKDRTNIVISRHDVEGADEHISDIESFITENQDTDEEIFIIGGGSIYAAFLPYAKNLYLTEVDSAANADVFFPDFDKSQYKKSIIKKGSENGIEYTFVKYTK